MQWVYDQWVRWNEVKINILALDRAQRAASELGHSQTTIDTGFVDTRDKDQWDGVGRVEDEVVCEVEGRELNEDIEEWYLRWDGLGVEPVILIISTFFIYYIVLFLKIGLIEY